MTTYKYTLDTEYLEIIKYMEDDELVHSYHCYEDFKEAKQHLLEELDKKVKRSLALTSRNYTK